MPQNCFWKLSLSSLSLFLGIAKAPSSGLMMLGVNTGSMMTNVSVKFTDTLVRHNLECSRTMGLYKTSTWLNFLALTMEPSLCLSNINIYI